MLRPGTDVSPSPWLRPQGCQFDIFKAKFQKFGLFKSGLAWKNGVWHVRHSLAFFGLFWWCWHEKTCLAFYWNLSLSCCCRLLELRAFSEDKGPLFSATVPFSKIQAALPCKWRHRATDHFFRQDFENWGSSQCRLGGFRKINMKNVKIWCWKRQQSDVNATDPSGNT